MSERGDYAPKRPFPDASDTLGQLQEIRMCTLEATSRDADSIATLYNHSYIEDEAFFTGVCSSQDRIRKRQGIPIRGVVERHDADYFLQLLSQPGVVAVGVEDVTRPGKTLLAFALLRRLGGGAVPAGRLEQELANAFGEIDYRKNKIASLSNVRKAHNAGVLYAVLEVSSQGPHASRILVEEVRSKIPTGASVIAKIRGETTIGKGTMGEKTEFAGNRRASDVAHKWDLALIGDTKSEDRILSIPAAVASPHFPLPCAGLANAAHVQLPTHILFEVYAGGIENMLSFLQALLGKKESPTTKAGSLRRTFLTSGVIVVGGLVWAAAHALLAERESPDVGEHEAQTLHVRKLLERAFPERSLRGFSKSRFDKCRSPEERQQYLQGAIIRITGEPEGDAMEGRHGCIVLSHNPTKPGFVLYEGNLAVGLCFDESDHPIHFIITESSSATYAPPGNGEEFKNAVRQHAHHLRIFLLEHRPHAPERARCKETAEAIREAGLLPAGVTAEGLERYFLRMLGAEGKNSDQFAQDTWRFLQDYLQE